MLDIEQSLGPTAKVAVVLCIMVSVYAWSVTRWRSRVLGRPLPPGPPGIPILGNLFNIPKVRPWFGYRDLCSTYGDIVFLTMFGQSVVVLGSAEVVLEYLEKRSANTSDKKQSPMIELCGQTMNMALLPYGQWWRRHRRLFWQHFHQRASLDYQSIQRDAAHQFLDKLLNNPSDFREHIRYTFAASILKVVYGITVLPENDPCFAIIDGALEGLAQGMVPGKFLVEFFPFLRHIPPWFPGAMSQRLFKKWQAAGNRLKTVPYARTQADMGKNEDGPPSIVSQIITQLDSVPMEVRAEEEEIAKNVAAVSLEGGADTVPNVPRSSRSYGITRVIDISQSFSTLHALFLAISLNPEVLQKAHAELDAVVGPDRLPDFEDEDALVYIRAIILETMRWHTVFPLAAPHCTSDDDELHGYFIPAGTVVIPNSWACLHDPNAYKDPDAFRPERFMKHGKIDPSVRNPADFAFGYGRRVCPGRYFASSSLFINVALVLHVFDIGPPLDDDGRPIEIKFVMTDGFLSYPEDCRCTIKPRSARAEALILAQTLKSN